MTGFRPTDIERAHNLHNIQRQLLNKEYRVLPNLTVMKVFKKTKEVIGKDDEGNEKISFTSAFPRGDFNWWHNPRWGDDEYAILIPLADATTYEKMIPDPRQQKLVSYNLQMEEIKIDLTMLTYCEIARYRENAGGEAAVLRFIATPVTIKDDITKEQRTLRAGFLDTVRLAERTQEEIEDVDVAYQTVGAGSYERYFWKDVPLDYVQKVANGRMGKDYQAQQYMAQQELARREREILRSDNGKLPNTVKFDPTEMQNRCEGVAVTTGERCKNEATVEIDGKWYCKTHAKMVETADVGGER